MSFFARTFLLLTALNSCLLGHVAAATDHGVPFRTVGGSMQEQVKPTRDSTSLSKQTGKKGTKLTKDTDDTKKTLRTSVPSSAPLPTHMRCGFMEQSSRDLDTLHANMTDTLVEKQRLIRFPTGGVIRVFFHVLQNDAGDGHVTGSQIALQMAVLNEAFSSGAWSFSLADVEYVVNNAWYQGLQDSAIEAQAKRALRRGTGEDLNIYSAYLPSYLGWAYLPNFYGGAYGHFDGVVIHTGSFPGGSIVNYNLGDTGKAQCRSWSCLEDSLARAEAVS